MESNRRKQLLEEYKNRCPEMGIICYRCKATGESFLSISKDTRADFNSVNVKLASNFHPNKRLLKLWNEYGSDGFELSVIKILKYDNPTEDHTAKLEAMLEECLASDPQSKRIWK